MEPSALSAIRTVLAAYEPGDLLALSDLHECLTGAVRDYPDSPISLELRGCVRTIEDQLSGGSYDLDDLFFENIQRILNKAGPGPSGPPTPEGSSEAPGGAEVNPEYIQTFTIELAERLNQAQELILKVEGGRTSDDEVNSLFRIFHTIKGEAGFLKLSVLADLFHGLEGLLDALRKAQLTATPELVDVLLKGIDAAEQGRERLGTGNYDLGPLQPQVDAVVAASRELLGQPAPSPAIPGPAPAETKEAPEPRTAEAVPRTEESLIKVSGTKLSYLVDMVGEMLILQNQMGDDSKEAQMLRKVSREVQQAAMSLRTVSLRGLFTKMKRAVRDVSRLQDKPVNVVALGENNEIDRSLVEAVEEPLIHLVRNCIGHGIEEASVRLAAGKPAVGSVKISAERRGNHVILGIEDDGKGLDAPAILATAVRNGLVTAEDAPGMSDSQIHELIFLDGLSTASRVDDISGRGVGMSIVKKTVERFRGSIHITTRRGAFTRFDLVFPLSMAILDGMVIELSTEKFIIPVENVLEAVRITDGMLVEVTGGTRVLRLRGEVIPIVDLAGFFYGTPVSTAEGTATAVIVESNKHDRYGFLVERVLEKREVVIKSLGHRFQALAGIAAAAILRGGEIGYLVDIDDITRPRKAPAGAAEGGPL